MTGNANEELSFVGPSDRAMAHAPVAAAGRPTGRATSGRA